MLVMVVVVVFLVDRYQRCAKSQPCEAVSAQMRLWFETTCCEQGCDGVVRRRQKG